MHKSSNLSNHARNMFINHKLITKYALYFMPQAHKSYLIYTQIYKRKLLYKLQFIKACSNKIVYIHRYDAILMSDMI